MIANLPLLFANGNPTALSKISDNQLEKFITFMVTCSWGHDTAKEIRQPPWWPADVQFSHPFVRPRDAPIDWGNRLKNLVRKCYDYHKSAFLLVFSAQLSRYPRNRLRYVDNRDHTTSLYYRPNGRLLVTFRNENLHYDSKSPPIFEEPLVKAADIYLCDNCDSHFDNLEVLKAHERLCNAEVAPSEPCVSGGLPQFLSALKLQPVGANNDELRTTNLNSEIKPKNIRSAANIDRGPPYPFSSLAYTRNAKPVQRDTAYSRERIERYCCTTNIGKTLGNKLKNQQFSVRYRRPIDYWNRKHIFPDQRNKRILDLKAQLLYLKCRPVTVRVERMSLGAIKEASERVKREAAERRATQQPEEVIDLCSDSEESVELEPRGGVACVMRGGAVLRRTAATPRALPDDPCGARQEYHPPPHPVILIAHTLNSLQTISLE